MAYSVVKLGGEFLVNTETAENQYTPKITARSGGGFVVTWTDASRTLGDNSGTGIKAQLFAANGAKFGSELLVNTKTASYQYNPTITRLIDKGFVIVWTDYDSIKPGSSGTSIKAQVFNAGGGKAGAEILVNTQTDHVRENPSITALADSGFVVTWEDFSEGGIKAQVLDSSGAKVGGEFLVNPDTAGY